MPPLYQTHRSVFALERELQEIWNQIDALGKRENRIRTLAAPGVPGAGGHDHDEYAGEKHFTLLAAGAGLVI